MTDVRELILSAIPAFTTTVLEVPDDAWDAPTPCDRWSVRDVVNHVTAEHLWAHRLLRGATLDEVGSAYDGDVVGADPSGAWRKAARDSAEAWAYSDLSAKVSLSGGPTTVADYGEQMLLDLAVHRWDVQRGANVGEALDGAVVSHLLGQLRERPDLFAAPGLFHDPLPTDSEYAHDQLLALVGRNPGWHPPA